MKAKIDEQLFIEQVLELVASIQKRDHLFSTAKTTGRISCDSKLGKYGVKSNSIGICGANSCIYGDIKIDKFENDKKIKTALEIAEKEVFDTEQEGSGIQSTTDRPCKIKNILIDVLCPPLLKTSDDVFEIAKSSTPVLLTLSLSGTISLPVQPVFFAAAAILLTRSGIAAICKGSNQSTSK